MSRNEFPFFSHSYARTRFPGQEGESHARDVKIPSVLYYDKQEKVRAVGAEASLEAVKQQALEEEWTYVKW